MSDPIRFLVSFGQAVSTMALYNDGHPARERAVDRSYRCLIDLQQHDPHPRFSFLGEETTLSNVTKSVLELMTIGHRPATTLGILRILSESPLSALHGMQIARELEKRFEKWQAPEEKYKRGILAKYARLVSSASKGAVTS